MLRSNDVGQGRALPQAAPPEVQTPRAMQAPRASATQVLQQASAAHIDAMMRMHRPAPGTSARPPIAVSSPPIATLQEHRPAHPSVAATQPPAPRHLNASQPDFLRKALGVHASHPQQFIKLLLNHFTPRQLDEVVVASEGRCDLQDLHQKAKALRAQKFSTEQIVELASSPEATVRLLLALRCAEELGSCGLSPKQIVRATNFSHLLECTYQIGLFRRQLEELIEEALRFEGELNSNTLFLLHEVTLALPALRALNIKGPALRSMLQLPDARITIAALAARHRKEISDTRADSEATRATNLQASQQVTPRAAALQSASGSTSMFSPTLVGLIVAAPHGAQNLATLEDLHKTLTRRCYPHDFIEFIVELAVRNDGCSKLERLVSLWRKLPIVSNFGRLAYRHEAQSTQDALTLEPIDPQSAATLTLHHETAQQLVDRADGIWRLWILWWHGDGFASLEFSCEQLGTLCLTSQRLEDLTSVAVFGPKLAQANFGKGDLLALACSNNGRRKLEIAAQSSHIFRADAALARSFTGAMVPVENFETLLPLLAKFLSSSAQPQVQRAVLRQPDMLETNRAQKRARSLPPQPSRSDDAT